MMLLVLCLLIVTSTTLFGLLSLWAATSAAHWFVRVACVAAVLSLALFIKKYPPVQLLLCFATQAVVVSLAFVLRNALDRPKHEGVSHSAESRWRLPRYSLRTMLLGTAVVAGVIFVGMHFPLRVIWNSLSTVGIQAAIQTLAGAWLCFGRTRLRLRCALALVLPALSLLGLVYVFEEADSIRMLPFGGALGVFPHYGESYSKTNWVTPSISICSGVVILTAVLLSLYCLPSETVERGSTSERRHTLRHAARIIALIMMVVMGILPARIYWRLLHPTPIPSVVLPNPNGYDLLVEAGRSANATKFQRAHELVREGLSHKALRPLRYDSSDADPVKSPHLNLRSLARTIRTKGDIALAEKKIGEASHDYLDLLRLAQRINNSGIMADGFVANDVELLGLGGIWKLSSQLSILECHDVIDSLLSVDRDWQPPEQILVRNRIWEEHAYGWRRRLQIALVELTPEDSSSTSKIFTLGMKYNEAIRRLLAVHLAIRAYQLENEDSPKTLDDLVPAYMPVVPRDPFSEGPLLYRREKNTNSLYSVGPNRIDEAGKRAWSGNQPESGDLSLESFLGDESESPSRKPIR